MDFLQYLYFDTSIFYFCSEHTCILRIIPSTSDNDTRKKQPRVLLHSGFEYMRRTSGTVYGFHIDFCCELCNYEVLVYCIVIGVRVLYLWKRRELTVCRPTIRNELLCCSTKCCQLQFGKIYRRKPMLLQQQRCNQKSFGGRENFLAPKRRHHWSFSA